MNKDKEKSREPFLFFNEKKDLENKLIFFKEEKDSLKIYSLFNEFLGYSNYIDLTHILKTKKSCITAVVNKKRKQLKGYIIIDNKDIV